MGRNAYNRPSTGLVTGELVGTATELVLPSIACQMVMFKAASDNTGFAYLGLTGITVAAGATNTTTGWQLGAGESTPWIPIDNLSRMLRICDSAADDLIYMAMK